MCIRTRAHVFGYLHAYRLHARYHSIFTLFNIWALQNIVLANMPNKKSVLSFTWYCLIVNFSTFTLAHLHATRFDSAFVCFRSLYLFIHSFMLSYLVICIFFKMDTYIRRRYRHRRHFQWVRCDNGDAVDVDSFGPCSMMICSCCCCRIYYSTPFCRHAVVSAVCSFVFYFE